MTNLEEVNEVPMNKEREFLPINIAVLTVSDTRTESDDKSGDLLVDRIK